jgi:hypothetical protein
MSEETYATHAQCPSCNGEVHGRSDKRFCEVKCKNKHHADARKMFAPRSKNTNKVQKRNVIILEGILGKTAGRMQVHKDALFKVGFDLNTCSRSYLKGTKIMREIGEYQFELLKNGIIEVVRLVEVSEFMPGFFERWEIDFPLASADVKGSGEDGEKRKFTESDLERFVE